MTHLINCAADPFVPKGWTLIYHSRALGQWQFDPGKIELFCTKGQYKAKRLNKPVRYDKLSKELNKKVTLDANVLDYLLENQELIPENWRCDHRGDYRRIFFWGTAYRDGYGNCRVRCLSWYGCGWALGDRPRMDIGWGGADPAAVLKEAA